MRARARWPQAVLRGHVLGISAWPGRELLENDKAHLVEKAHAAARSVAMGLTPAPTPRCCRMPRPTRSRSPPRRPTP